MLSSLVRDAVVRREEILENLRGKSYGPIVKMAAKKWTEYAPSGQPCSMLAIDSSYNSARYQGVEMWAVDAVSVSSDNQIAGDLFDHGISRPDRDISAAASEMEDQLCIKAAEKAELVLVDGSIHPRLSGRDGPGKRWKAMQQALGGRGQVAFISKTSDSQEEFRKFRPVAADIFYYAHASRAPGFSEPYVDARYGIGNEVTSAYARLAESLPLIKIELYGRRSVQDITGLMDALSPASVAGYPYALRLAHENCKIAESDMQKLAKMYGMAGEAGARELLR